MKREAAVALACGSIALFVGLISVRAASGTEGDTSRLVRMSDVEPMAEVARAAQPGFAFVPAQGHYDGVYFYAIAHDPLALGEGATRIDFPSYRYGHPGYGWASAIVSLGMDGWIVPAMLVVGLAGIFVAAFCASLISSHFGRTPWAGLLVAANPGVIYALISLTSETLAIALLAASVLFYLRRRLLPAVLCLTALALVKEPFVLVAAAFALDGSIRGEGNDRSRRAVAFTIPLAALGLWFVYLKVRLGTWSFTDGPENLGAPLRGWSDALRMASDMTLGAFDTMQLGSAALPLLVAVALALVVGSVAALRHRGLFDLIFLGQVAVIACVSSLVLLYPKDMLRNVAIPLALLPIVLIGGSRDDRRDEAGKAPGVP